jgi:hypothetical protein
MNELYLASINTKHQYMNDGQFWDETYFLGCLRQHIGIFTMYCVNKTLMFLSANPTCGWFDLQGGNCEQG